MRAKTLILWRVADNAYTIYKLSNNAYPVKELYIGMAYDENGDYSKSFCRDAEAAGIDIFNPMMDMTTTAETKKEFMKRVYLQWHSNQNAVPKVAFEECKYIYEREKNANG